jgi:hypothetical protein
MAGRAAALSCQQASDPRSLRAFAIAYRQDYYFFNHQVLKAFRFNRLLSANSVSRRIYGNRSFSDSD